jgi:uncharacterized protein YecT (DUF1311 family)
MRASALTPRILTLTALALALCLSARVFATGELGVFAEFAKADADLNETYKQVMAGLSPPARESLRRAQRAWISYLDKDISAIAEHFSLEQRWRIRLNETRARREELQVMLKPSSHEGATQLLTRLRDADRELNESYGKALAALADDANSVREAQRLWITYRDENAHVYKGAETETTLALTTQRASQLRSFIALKAEGSAGEDENVGPQIVQDDDKVPPGRKVPNPFDRAR